MSSGEKKIKKGKKTTKGLNQFQYLDILRPVAPIRLCLTNKDAFLLPTTLFSMLFQPTQTKEISKSISLRKARSKEYFFSIYKKKR